MQQFQGKLLPVWAKIAGSRQRQRLNSTVMTKMTSFFDGNPGFGRVCRRGMAVAKRALV